MNTIVSSFNDCTVRSNVERGSRYVDEKNQSTCGGYEVKLMMPPYKISIQSSPVLTTAHNVLMQKEVQDMLMKGDIWVV